MDIVQVVSLVSIVRLTAVRVLQLQAVEERLRLHAVMERVTTENRVVPVQQIAVHVLREEAAEMVLVVQVNPVQAVRLTAAHVRPEQYVRGQR